MRRGDAGERSTGPTKADNIMRSSGPWSSSRNGSGRGTRWPICRSRMSRPNMCRVSTLAVVLLLGQDNGVPVALACYSSGHFVPALLACCSIRQLCPGGARVLLDHHQPATGWSYAPRPTHTYTYATAQMLLDHHQPRPGGSSAARPGNTEQCTCYSTITSQCQVGRPLLGQDTHTTRLIYYSTRRSPAHVRWVVRPSASTHIHTTVLR